MQKTAHRSLRKFLALWAALFVGVHVLYIAGYLSAGYYLRNLSDYEDGAWPPTATGLPVAAAADIQAFVAKPLLIYFIGAVFAAAVSIGLLLKIQSIEYKKDEAKITIPNNSDSSFIEIDGNITKTLFWIIICYAISPLIPIIILIITLPIANKKLIFDLSISQRENPVEQFFRYHFVLGRQIPIIVMMGLFFFLVTGISLYGFRLENALIGSIPNSAMEFLNENPESLKSYLIDRGPDWIPSFVSCLLWAIFCWLVRIGKPGWLFSASRPPPA